MRISKTSREAIEKALAEVNEMFENNIEFLRFDRANAKGTIFNVRLKVKDSSKPGTLFSAFRTRKDGEPCRTASACWHVHGYFHDALNPEAVIYSNGQKKRPGDPWVDWNAGSMLYPCMQSYRCDC